MRRLRRPNVYKLSCGARLAKRAVRAAHLAAVIPTMTCAARIGRGRRPRPTSVSFNGLLDGADADLDMRSRIAATRDTRGAGLCATTQELLTVAMLILILRICNTHQNLKELRRATWRNPRPV